jgi:murein DD-endopeptidase MepM/ murein hydrolase activator NlpD
MHISENILFEQLKNNSYDFHPVIILARKSSKIISLDLSSKNESIHQIDLQNILQFSQYIDDLLHSAGADFGIGGYNELRGLYSRSELFSKDVSGNENNNEEPRRLHLGTDIWGPVGTSVFAPLDGVVHSFAFNDNYGDYGATLILKHEIEGIIFHTLYGHISLKDIENLYPGNKIQKGQLIAHLGKEEENGHWPPHLHFQVIENIGDYQGDYPGVCKESDREYYLRNCPDPDLILNLNRLAV